MHTVYYDCHVITEAQKPVFVKGPNGEAPGCISAGNACSNSSWQPRCVCEPAARVSTGAALVRTRMMVTDHALHSPSLPFRSLTSRFWVPPHSNALSMPAVCFKGNHSGCACVCRSPEHNRVLDTKHNQDPSEWTTTVPSSPLLHYPCHSSSTSLWYLPMTACWCVLYVHVFLQHYCRGYFQWGNNHYTLHRSTCATRKVPLVETEL